MNWYRSWREVRDRMALCLLMIAVLCTAMAFGTPTNLERMVRLGSPARHYPQLPPADQLYLSWWHFNGVLLSLVLIMVATTLAGSGVNSQTITGTSHGLNNSNLFTLSLPVSRSRWFWMRTTLGAAATLLLSLSPYLVIYFAQPFPGRLIPLSDILQHLPCALLGAAVFYTSSVMLTSFLDEFWQSLTALSLILGLFGIVSAGNFYWLDIFEFMTSDTYLVTGRFPWAGAIACLCLCASALGAAYLIVQRKEY